MSIEQDKKRLLQIDNLSHLTQPLRPMDMVTVSFSSSDKDHNRGVHPALVPIASLEGCLSDTSWSMTHGNGHPGAVIYHEGKSKITKYLRFGDDNGFEPLVIDREFHGIRDDYVEIAEEFRLFHRLYHDRKQDRYIKISDFGVEEVIAIVGPDRVQIRVKEIRQFLAVKEMCLLVQFDFKEFSRFTPAELSLPESQEHRDKDLVWDLHSGDMQFGDSRAFSRLLGKRVVQPVEKAKSGFWGFAEEEKKKHVEFIIGVNDSGDELLHTSDPDQLANFFGANPGAPQYLTPVDFRKSVLDKYYQQPSKYSVDDAVLRCGGLWLMQLDNHHDDKVTAWLGDLGRDLPYEEQLHWRSHNVSPTGGVSETYFRRQILAQPTDSDRLDHLFRRRYAELSKRCEERLGWRILLPLEKGDEHHLESLRIPSQEEQRDFDELILALTKLLVDSLNEKTLITLLPSDQSSLLGSIKRLEAVLKKIAVPDYETHVHFLKSLQGLRSAGAAHRKGSNYRKIAKEFGIEDRDLRIVFAGILNSALAYLEYLIMLVRGGHLDKKAGQ